MRGRFFRWKICDFNRIWRMVNGIFGTYNRDQLYRTSGSDIDLSHIAGAKKIAAGGAHVLALLSDGTVAAAGNAVACTTSSWSGVTGVFAAGNLSVGLKNDGT